jgi:hypothetical protein
VGTGGWSGCRWDPPGGAAPPHRAAVVGLGHLNLEMAIVVLNDTSCDSSAARHLHLALGPVRAVFDSINV